MHNQQTYLIEEFYALYAQTLETRGISRQDWAILEAIENLPHINAEQQEMCDRLHHLIEKGWIQFC
ncbi:MAG: MarR family transcriptional regulator [Spirulina sp. SIO3F2]|nr:MarR family transcriptional regulator [Spirulina sp. SIO3F2]